MVTKPQLLTNREAAEFLRITPKTLENWRANGNKYGIRFTRVGGRVFYFAEDLQKWLNSRTEGTLAAV